MNIKKTDRTYTSCTKPFFVAQYFLFYLTKKAFSGSIPLSVSKICKRLLSVATTLDKHFIRYWLDGTLRLLKLSPGVYLFPVLAMWEN